jgi:hypothetical protein
VANWQWHGIWPAVSGIFLAFPRSRPTFPKSNATRTECDLSLPLSLTPVHLHRIREAVASHTTPPASFFPSGKRRDHCRRRPSFPAATQVRIRPPPFLFPLSCSLQSTRPIACSSRMHRCSVLHCVNFFMQSLLRLHSLILFLVHARTHAPYRWIYQSLMDARAQRLALFSSRALSVMSPAPPWRRD